MNILFVSMVPFESNTSATIQNKGIVKGLIKLGHNVDVITPKITCNAISYDESMNDIKNLVRNYYYIELNTLYAKLMAKKPYNKIDKKINKCNTKIFTVKLKNVIRSIIKILYDKISIFDAQKLNVKKVSKLKINYYEYDIIISSSDPKSSHLIVEKIKKENPNIKAKWIQYWGDPMFHDITRNKDWRDLFVKYNEKKLIKKADRIIYASPITLKLQQDTYPDYAKKMDYANQVFLNECNQDEFKKKTDSSNITIGYFGAYYSNVRNILPLYNVARSKEFKLNICGNSDIELESTDNISIYGSVTYKNAKKMESESDILVCICNKFGTQIPGKIYYCAGYNKPIIVILDGEYKEELRDYFESFNRFILCYNNEKSITEAIIKAIEQLKIKNYNISEYLKPEYMAKKIINNLNI